jgi:5,10-methylenetetrahydrofolate reductase
MDGKDKEAEVGFEISSRVLQEITAFHPKVHLMTHNRFDLCSKLLDELN